MFVNGEGIPKIKKNKKNAKTRMRTKKIWKEEHKNENDNENKKKIIKKENRSGKNICEQRRKKKIKEI
jgi:hypothetical protein